MNYYQRFLGDYARDTRHLSLIAHGAYSLLLDAYYATEKPLPEDTDSLCRICGAINPAERAAVEKIADLFFPKGQDGLRHNKRADIEIAKALPRIAIARANGSRRGNPAAGQQEAAGLPGGYAGGSPDASQREPIWSTALHLHQSSSPTPPKTTTDAKASPPGFEELWKAYPKRAGNNPKARAVRCYRARLSEKHTPQEMIEGAQRYAKFCATTGKTGTELVLQAATFLGPDKGFLQVWTAANGNGEWWKSEGATLKKGQEVGVNARPGESMEEYRGRIRERISA